LTWASCPLALFMTKGNRVMVGVRERAQGGAFVHARGAWGDLLGLR